MAFPNPLNAGPAPLALKDPNKENKLFPFTSENVFYFKIDDQHSKSHFAIQILLKIVKTVLCFCQP
jgi:hypothetical protein